MLVGHEDPGAVQRRAVDHRQRRRGPGELLRQPHVVLVGQCPEVDVVAGVLEQAEEGVREAEVRADHGLDPERAQERDGAVAGAVVADGQQHLDVGLREDALHLLPQVPLPLEGRQQDLDARHLTSLGVPLPRVVHVIARMNVGGPAELVVQLLRGLPDQALLTGDVEDGEADHLALRAPGTPHTRVPGLGRSPRPGDDLRALGLPRARAAAPATGRRAHPHGEGGRRSGGVAARAARVPHVVHTFHGHLLHGYFSPAVTAAVVLTERVLARRTDRLVAVGEQVRDDLLAARHRSARAVRRRSRRAWRWTCRTAPTAQARRSA